MLSIVVKNIYNLVYSRKRKMIFPAFYFYEKKIPVNTKKVKKEFQRPQEPFKELKPTNTDTR